MTFLHFFIIPTAENIVLTKDFRLWLFNKKHTKKDLLGNMVLCKAQIWLVFTTALWLCWLTKKIKYPQHVLRDYNACLPGDMVDTGGEVGRPVQLHGRDGLGVGIDHALYTLTERVLGVAVLGTWTQKWE